MNRLKNCSFKYRIFFANLLIAMVPLLLCSLLMLQIFTSTLSRQSDEASRQKTQELGGQLTQALAESREILCALSENTLVQQALVNHISDELSLDVYLAVYQATNGAHSGAEFALYDAGGQLQFRTQDNMAEKLPVSWGLLRQASDNGETAVFCRAEADALQTDGVCLQMARPILTQQGIRVGYAVCGLSRAQVTALFSGMTESNDRLMLLGPQGRLFYASRSDGAADDAAMLRSALISGVLPEADGVRYAFYTEAETGIYLVLRQPSAITTGAVRLMRTISAVSAAICLLLCVLLSLQLSRSLVSPVEAMSTAMGRVRSGDLTVRIPIDRQDELGQLSETFNDMTERLDAYMQEQLQRQKDLNDARLRQMQAQLNPHFLYNTLDTVKWLAKIHKVPEVASLASNLAVILRSSIKGEPFIPLQQELELSDRYLAIQKIRFPGKFEYRVEVPEALLGCLVPKLILQPLVENALLHGLDGRDSGTVTVCGEAQDGYLILRVSDDGCGMEQEMVERLNSPEPKLLDGHLGLYNVGRILQLYYGTALHAVSEKGRGTTVTVRIPEGGVTC